MSFESTALEQNAQTAGEDSLPPSDSVYTTSIPSKSVVTTRSPSKPCVKQVTGSAGRLETKQDELLLADVYILCHISIHSTFYVRLDSRELLYNCYISALHTMSPGYKS